MSVHSINVAKCTDSVESWNNVTGMCGAGRNALDGVKGDGDARWREGKVRGWGTISCPQETSSVNAQWVTDLDPHVHPYSCQGTEPNGGTGFTTTTFHGKRGGSVL